MDAVRLLLFPALMAFAACSDFLTMTIPNKVALALLGGFFVMALAVGMSPVEVAMHLGASVTVFVLAFACFSFGWIGGGDAKLVAATALWFGFEQLLPYLYMASLLGGALTLLLLQFRMIPLPNMLRGQGWAERLHSKNSGIPYGITLAAAALMVYPDTVWMSPALA